MTGIAYIFAHIDLRDMTVQRVRIMSDRNPTCMGYDAYLLIEKIEHGKTYSEALEKAETYLQPGGFLYRRWYKVWDQRQAEVQYEQFTQNANK